MHPIVLSDTQDGLVYPLYLLYLLWIQKYIQYKDEQHKRKTITGGLSEYALMELFLFFYTLITTRIKREMLAGLPELFSSWVSNLDFIRSVKLKLHGESLIWRS